MCFRFSPTDEELIEILNQKVSGNSAMTPLNFIVERNIYEFEPQDLQWTQSLGLNKNEKYYYCRRESDSREVTGRGWWKATSHVKTISSNGRVVGCKRPLTFHKFRDNQTKRKDAIKTDWIMHEYGLQSIPTEWRLCKIMYRGKEMLEEDMENIRNDNPMSSEAGVSSNSINPMQLEYFAFEEQQPFLPPLPENNDYENYFWSSSSFDDLQQQQGLAQPSSLFDPSSSMPILTPSYDDFAQQDNQQSFADLWSEENWHCDPSAPSSMLFNHK
ncbi:NAC domain-containing protein 83-like [Durio zibethinus]|uniref:NAC domain-containing protein 83-like n=1 Tax=Durio zibethinus TaxID=66656 RepID=A0A6P5X3P8_DURZI|nr:NAC domain-containing protein 83-like [Durio zibethinus]